MLNKVIFAIDDNTALHTVAKFMRHMDENMGDLERTREMLQDNYCGTYKCFQDYADEYVDECILPDVSNETARNYFDYESFALDLAMDMIVIDVPEGVMAFHAN